MRLIVLLSCVLVVAWLSLRALHRSDLPAPLTPDGAAEVHKPVVPGAVTRDLEKALEQGMRTTARELQKAESQ